MRHSIRVYIKPPLSDGRCPLRFRVSWNGQRLERTLDNTIPPDQWDPSTNTPRRTARAAIAEINTLTADIQRAFDTARLEHRIPSPDDIRTAMGIYGHHLPGEPSFADICITLSNLPTITGAWSDNTRNIYLSFAHAVAAWNPSVTPSAIDDKAANDFLSHCFASGIINSSAMKYLTLFRWALRTAAAQKLCPPSPAANFRPRFRHSSENDVVYLTFDELRRLSAIDLSASSDLFQCRDLFLFCCFSGLRYSDALKLLKTDIHTDHIRIVTRKTSDPLTIELNDTTRAILQRYADTPGTHALPTLAIYRYNRHLKTIAHLAGIDAPVSRVWWVGSQRHEKSLPKWQAMSSHCARRTFVVTALTLGIHSEVVMKWTGHKNHETMKPYVAIVDDLRRQSMNKFNQLHNDDV